MMFLVVTSKYQSTPKRKGSDDNKIVIVYLRRHNDIFIFSDGFELKLEVLVDSSFNRDQFDNRSMSGHLIALSGRTVS